MKSDKESSFERSHQLSLQHAADAVSPYELTAILSSHSISYVLIGGHVLGYLIGSPRATVDVDVLVSSSHVAKAVQAIKAKFPQLDAEDLRYNVRFSSRAAGGHVDRERIDVVRSDNAFFKEILEKHAVPVNSKGQVIHVPSVEAAVAMKFAAAISPNRGDESRPQDRVDLLAIIRKHTSLDSRALQRLGDLVYPGGGKELCDLVTAIGEGKKASF